MDKVLGMGNALVDIMTKLNNDDLLGELNLKKGSMQLVDATFSSMVIEKTKNLSQTITAGGSAANTIHGLARLGIPTGFIGKVGADEMGQYFKKDLTEAGIQALLLESNNASGKAIALVTPDAERTFATFLGAAVELSADDINPDIFNGYTYFHIEGYLVQNHELIETAMKIAKRKGLKVSLDLASYNVVEENLTFLKRVVNEYVDIVFANEEEARSFTGKEPEDAADIMACMCDIAVVKIGKMGSIIRRGTELYRAGIIPVTSIDTTGAGDLYAAGFLYGLIRGRTLENSGRMGALLSGKVIENMGAKISRQGWDFIETQIK